MVSLKTRATRTTSFAYFSLSLALYTFVPLSEDVALAQDSIFDVFNTQDEQKKPAEVSSEGGCSFPSKLPGRVCLVNGCNEGNKDPVCSAEAGHVVRPFIIISCSCTAGYERTTDSGAAYCIDGQWLPVLPTCLQATTHKEHQSGPKSTTASSVTPGGKDREVECKFPFSEGRTCSINGCVPGSSADDPNCVSTPGVYVRSYVILSCSCHSGYQFTPDSDDVAYCGSGGQWLPKVPECFPIPKTSTTAPATRRPSATTASIASSPTSGCLLPTGSENRKCCLSSNRGGGCEEIAAGSRVSQFDIVTCFCQNHSYTLATNTDKSLCLLGSWAPDVPDCKKSHSGGGGGGGGGIEHSTRSTVRPITSSTSSSSSGLHPPSSCPSPAIEAGRRCELKNCHPSEGRDCALSSRSGVVSQFDSVVCVCERSQQKTKSKESLCVLGAYSPDLLKCDKPSSG